MFVRVPTLKNIFEVKVVLGNERTLWLSAWHITTMYILDAVGSSRILIGKQKIGLTFNSDKLGGNDFTKFSKLTMCSA